MSRQSEVIKGGHAPFDAQVIVGLASAISGAGTTAADATVISTTNVLISGGAGSSGVKLPSDANAGDSFNIKNESGQTILLYPPTGATINTTTSLSIATAKSVTVFFSSATKCHSIPTVAS